MCLDSKLGTVFIEHRKCLLWLPRSVGQPVHLRRPMEMRHVPTDPNGVFVRGRKCKQAEPLLHCSLHPYLQVGQAQTCRSLLRVQLMTENHPTAGFKDTPLPNAQHAVLNHYYDNVVSLQDYLTLCLPAELVDEAIDPISYRHLLQRAYVAWSTPEGTPKRFIRAHDEPEALDALVRRAQRYLLSSTGRPDNVLCYGFTLASLFVSRLRH